jgi:quercetin dioxygenase-like cupin family protein
MSTTNRRRPLGETSGSDQRPSRELTGAAMAFDIALELATLEQEPSWQRGDRNARTLVERDGFRLVLTALKMGARLRPHRTRGWVSTNVIEGLLRVRTTIRELEVPAGHILVLERNESHAAEVVEDSAFVLTVAGLDHPNG